MNLTIAKVLSCTKDGCNVQEINSDQSIATVYSSNVIEYDISIRPNQFVIVDRAHSPPQTLFRFSRATVEKVSGEQIELDDNGTTVIAQRSSALHDDLEPGIEVVFNGYTDENRRVIDIVLDDKPAHVDQLAAEWFPLMDR